MLHSPLTRYLEILWDSKCSMMCVCNSKCKNVSHDAPSLFHKTFSFFTDQYVSFQLRPWDSLYCCTLCSASLRIGFYAVSVKAIFLFFLIRNDDACFLEWYVWEARIISLQTLQISITWHCETSDFWCVTTWQKHVIFLLAYNQKQAHSSLTSWLSPWADFYLH